MPSQGVGKGISRSGTWAAAARRGVRPITSGTSCHWLQDASVVRFRAHELNRKQPHGRDCHIGLTCAMAIETSAPRPSVGASHPQPSRITVRDNRGVKVVRSVTIRRPAADLYAFWRSFENLPRIIKHPVSITQLSDSESHWRVSAPGDDRFVEWDALIINDEPNQLIAWRTKEGADVPNAGTVRFEPAPGDEGTEVTVQLEYDVKGGKLAALFAKLTGEEPEQQVAEALRRCKALMEAGEIPTVEGQSAGGPQKIERAKERQQRLRRSAS